MLPSRVMPSFAYLECHCSLFRSVSWILIRIDLLCFRVMPIACFALLGRNAIADPQPFQKSAQRNVSMEYTLFSSYTVKIHYNVIWDASSYFSQYNRKVYHFFK